MYRISFFSFIGIWLGVVKRAQYSYRLSLLPSSVNTDNLRHLFEHKLSLTKNNDSGVTYPPPQNAIGMDQGKIGQKWAWKCTSKTNTRVLNSETLSPTFLIYMDIVLFLWRTLNLLNKVVSS